MSISDTTENPEKANILGNGIELVKINNNGPMTPTPEGRCKIYGKSIRLTDRPGEGSR